MANDVLIVGAGPVGLTAALLLAKFGLRVELIEREVEPAAEARAVSLDDEGLRIWQACGVEDLLRDDWAGGEQGQCVCTYRDGRGRSFLRIHQRISELGHPHAVAIHQGRIVRKLIRAAEGQSLIRLRRGRRVQRIDQTEWGASVRGVGEDGQGFVCTAPWVIACDGANSTARAELGIAMDGVELKHPWLVANLADLGEPGHVTIDCRTNAAAVTMPLPHGMRRVEVQLDEFDDGAWLGNDGEVRRRLVRAWKGAAEAAIASVAICRFRAMVASRWREGRVFLAGDAAHLMPPFAGQGLGAGLRDVANLSFKIAGACQGWLSPAVLDTYETERRPHVERIMRLACRLGRLMSPRSAMEGRLIHAALRMLGAFPALGGRWLLRGPSIQPRLESGFLVPSASAGRYIPQPEVVAADHRLVRLDEMLGPRMTWIVLGGRASNRPHLSPPLLQPSDSVLTEGRDFHDQDLVLRRRYGAGSLLLVRPDRMVYCHIKPARRGIDPIRRIACLSDMIALREVRLVAGSSAPSSPPHLRDASRTVPIHAL